MERTTLLKSIIKGRHGGLSLEAAIIMPLVIVVIIFMIQIILLIRVEIVISTALDNTADEIALILPAIEMVVDGSDFEKSIAAFEYELLGDTDIELLIEEAAIDFASSVLFSRLIDERFAFWLEKVTSDQEVSVRSVSSTRMQLELRLEKNYLLLCQNVELKTIFGQMERTIVSAVPVWIGANENYDKKLEDEETVEDEIWQLGNLKRGKRIRELFGANLPFNYPVIARFENGSAVSIASIDLTAPTYNSQENIKQKIEHKLTGLANFRGYQSSSPDYPDISSEDIITRKLILIIPENSPEKFHEGTKQELGRIAQSLDIQIEIVQYGNSRRFENSSADDSQQY